ncbi:FecR family protein [uncultured Chitinophaga sp.]|uniref:FecR family protein n=1 Tax=uncultured Chitinophaga sp. TaxID=339340 RepID=UPI0025CDBFB8|nr:FecR domain-containing protein [uncultured Chitinophaga sp.]
MQEQRFYYLVNRQVSGLASEDEQAELQRLIQADQGLAAIYGEMFPDMQQEDEHSEALQAYTAHYTRMQLSGLFEQEEAPVRRRRLPYYIIAAASALLLLAAGWWMLDKKEQPKAVAGEVKTRKGDKTRLNLPDGSVVWLNGNSQLLFDTEFNHTHRNVQLTGEAYFDVTHDSNRPFVIQANGLTVKVLGTTFGVRAYPDEPSTETMLVSGAVEVTVDGQPGNTIQLKPGQKLRVLNGTNIKATEDTDTDAAPLLSLSKMRFSPNDTTLADVAWVDNKLVFDGDAFDLVISKMEKWYNITIVVENEALYNASFTGVFNNKPLTTVLNTLQATGKLTYSRRNDTVYVR